MTLIAESMLKGKCDKNVISMFFVLMSILHMFSDLRASSPQRIIH